MEIPLTQDCVALVDDEDYPLVIPHRWHLHEDGRRRYARGMVDGKRILMHRFIMQPARHEKIDHRNGNCLDNRKENLRICSDSLNRANAPKQEGYYHSEYKGVSKSGGRWFAQIKVQGRKIHLGTFTDEREAAIAYNEAAISAFGEFARLNTLTDG